MKLTRYAAMFLLVILSLIVILQLRIDKFSKYSDRKVQYNNALDSAIDAALEGVVVSADRNEVTVDKDLCVKNYYKSLYASFNASDDPAKQEMLNLYTPVVALADEKGLWVYYSDLEGGEIKKVWSTQTPYSRTLTIPNPNTPSGEIKFNITFTMSGIITISIQGDRTIYSGSWETLQERYTSSEYYGSKIETVLKSEYLGEIGHFQLWKKQIISEVISERLSYYVNRHNEIASYYGEAFTFGLPVTSSSDVARSIDGVSFISFFQGYPYGSGTDDVYSNFEISGARISKDTGYYVRSTEVGGKHFLYYHKIGCTEGDGNNYWCSTREECALQGAMPCPDCKP